MQDANDMIFDEALKLKGTWEWAGEDHNPVVLAMYADVGHHEIRRDEVPWCAAYVGSVLAKIGIQHTGSLVAKSYLNWGEKVNSLADAKPGDVVIFHRGSKSWQGHVGFFVDVDGDNILCLGGNQRNEVNISRYPSSKLAGIRRAKKPRTSIAKSKTAQATGAGIASTVVASAPVISSLDGTAQIIAVAGGLLLLVVFAFIFRERLKHWVGGVR